MALGSVLSRNIAMPCYLPFFVRAPMYVVGNVVNDVYMVEFFVFRGARRVFANCIYGEPACRLSRIQCTQFLTLISIQCRNLCKEFFRQLLCVLELRVAGELVADAHVLEFCPRDAKL